MFERRRWVFESSAIARASIFGFLGVSFSTASTAAIRRWACRIDARTPWLLLITHIGYIRNL